MSNQFYRTLSRFSQYFRKKNYKLYRKFVESVFVKKMLSFFFRNKCNKVLTPEGYAMFIHPLYHGQFIEESKVKEYEKDIRSVLEKLTEPGMVVYDIGANVGVFSLFFAHKVGKTGKVYVFEPEENNYVCLEKSQTFNNINNIQIEKVCISDVSGIQYFDRRGGAFSGRVVKEDEKSKSNVIEVRSYSLDDFVYNEKNEIPNLMKIDVEGVEYKVFQGMHKILRDARPIILCELHKRLCDSIPEIFEILKTNNYICYDIRDYLQSEKKALNTFDLAHFIVAIPQSD